MANLIFNQPRTIKVQPIRAAFWYNASVLGGHFGVFWLSKGSYYETQEITMPHSEGGNSQQGHKVMLEMIIPHNEFQTNELIDKLELLISKTERNERIDLQVLTGTKNPPAAAPDGYTPTANNSNAGLWVEFNKMMTYTYHVDQRDIIPKAIVKGEGFTFLLNNIAKHQGTDGLKFFN